MNTGHDTSPASRVTCRAPGSVRQQLQAIARALGRGRPAARSTSASAPSPTRSARPATTAPTMSPGVPLPRAALRRGPRGDPSRAMHVVPPRARRRARDRSPTEPTAATATRDLDVKNGSPRRLAPHARRGQRWDTCLGCHDFHGNHGLSHRPARRRDRPAAIQTYLDGGPSPYPAPIIRARTPEVTTP